MPYGFWTQIYKHSELSEIKDNENIEINYALGDYIFIGLCVFLWLELVINYYLAITTSPGVQNKYLNLRVKDR